MTFLTKFTFYRFSQTNFNNRFLITSYLIIFRLRRQNYYEMSFSCGNLT
jgi:hypothetical protein